MFVYIGKPFPIAEVKGGVSSEYTLTPGLYELEDKPIHTPLADDSKKGWLVLKGTPEVIGATIEWWKRNVTEITDKFGNFGNEDQNTWIAWA